jgi:hypothetical protein
LEITLNFTRLTLGSLAPAARPSCPPADRCAAIRLTRTSGSTPLITTSCGTPAAFLALLVLSALLPNGANRTSLHRKICSPAPTRPTERSAPRALEPVYGPPQPLAAFPAPTARCLPRGPHIYNSHTRIRITADAAAPPRLLADYPCDPTTPGRRPSATWSQQRLCRH